MQIVRLPAWYTAGSRNNEYLFVLPMSTGYSFMLFMNEPPWVSNITPSPFCVEFQVKTAYSVKRKTVPFDGVTASGNVAGLIVGWQPSVDVQNICMENIARKAMPARIVRFRRVEWDAAITIPAPATMNATM